MEEDFFGPKPKQSNRRLFTVVLIFIILIFAGLAYFTFSKNQIKTQASAVIVNLPQADNTADWKTYANDKYGYSIKYPNNWYVFDKDPTEVKIQPDQELTADELQTQGTDLTYLKAINIEVKDSGTQTLADLITAAYPTYIYTKEAVQIDGQDGFKVKTGCLANDCARTDIFVIFNNRLYRFKQNQSLDSDVFDKMVSTIKLTQTIQSSISNLVDLKTYTNQDLKFEFKYPALWQDLAFYPVEKDQLTKGNAFTSLYQENSTQPVYYDPDNLYSFSIYSKDFDNHIITTPSAEKVDLTWDKQTFIDHIKPQDTVMGYQVLGKNAVLVITHSDRECFPNFQITVYVPTNNPNYPNLMVNINTADIDKDQTVVDYLHFQSAGGKSVCDTTLPYQDIADKIINGTYSVKMKTEIQTIQDLADSFKNL